MCIAMAVSTNSIEIKISNAHTAKHLLIPPLKIYLNLGPDLTFTYWSPDSPDYGNWADKE